MPLGLIGAGLIGTGISALGSLIGNGMNQKASDKAYEKDLKLMKYQNEYNSPAQQMDRLKAAGLNPNLVYGSGNVTGNLTGNLPRYQAPQKHMDLSGGEQGVKILQASQDMKVKNVMMDKYAQDMQATEVKTVGQQIENLILTTENLQKQFELTQLQKLAPYNLEIKTRQAEQASINVDNLTKVGKLRDSELETKKAQRVLLYSQIAKSGLDIEQQELLIQNLKKGIQPNDSMLFRIGAKLIDELGFKSWQDLFNSVKGFDYDKFQEYKNKH